jgi:hypothetical protein
VVYGSMKKAVSESIKFSWANVLPDILKARMFIGLFTFLIFYEGGLLCIEN